MFSEVFLWQPHFSRPPKKCNKRSPTNQTPLHHHCSTDSSPKLRHEEPIEGVLDLPVRGRILLIGGDLPGDVHRVALTSNEHTMSEESFCKSGDLWNAKAKTLQKVAFLEVSGYRKLTKMHSCGSAGGCFMISYRKF